MNAMIVAPRTMDWHRLKSLVLDSVSSPITRRVYNLGLDEFFFSSSYATAAGVPRIAPHDLRRSCAKLCRAAGGELEQIQCCRATHRSKRPSDTSGHDLANR